MWQWYAEIIIHTYTEFSLKMKRGKLNRISKLANFGSRCNYIILCSCGTFWIQAAGNLSLWRMGRQVNSNTSLMPKCFLWSLEAVGLHIPGYKIKSCNWVNLGENYRVYVLSNSFSFWLLASCKIPVRWISDLI